MSKRPLRTAPVAKPTTTGERIRYARLACNLTQPALAAGIAQLTNAKISKALVSNWENDVIVSPNHANLSAIQAITGFAVEWLATGKGEQKATLRSSDLDIDRLERILKAIAPGRTGHAREARVIALLYKVLADTPKMPPALLAEIAQNSK